MTKDPSDIVILDSTMPRPSGQRIAGIARFMGIPVAAAGGDATGAVIAAHCESLRGGITETESWRRARTVLVYGWRDSPGHNELLAPLTKGRLRAVTPPQQAPRKISCAEESRDYSFALAGLDVEVAEAGGIVGFVAEGEAPAVRCILRHRDVPFFLEVKTAGPNLVLLGGEDIADLAAPVAPGASPLDEFPRLAPVLMFLRNAFGAHCWHAESARASVIIDDPLLRRKYGFLDYSSLLESMRRWHYSTSIAFIPWNYRRSDPSIADLFRARSDLFSICVHGCDHTRGEFGTTDEERIRYSIGAALWRMGEHQRRYSLPFDPVMVFPQGLFSKAAIKALTQSPFLAAINSGAFPVDSQPAELTLADLMEPAITRFSNFPLFIRRHPKSAAEFAFDHFLGKAILIAEHHGCFRAGAGTLEEFISRINALDAQLRWSSPGALCTRACRQRQDESGVAVRFYTDEFILQNARDCSQHYSLSRRVDCGSPVTSVAVNGHPADWSVRGDLLHVHLELDARREARVSIVRSTPNTKCVFRPGLAYRTKVLFRRRFSEFRDNFVDKSPVAKRIVQAIRKS